MELKISEAIEVLERTPTVLSHLLGGLSESWTHRNETGDSWSPYDVMGHLIHGEKTDWIPRLEIILGGNGSGRFTPFDRFAQFRDSEGKSLHDLLKEFSQLRAANLTRLKSHKLSADQLTATGIHPALGVVTLKQLIATWVAHDLNHISQIVRVMAFQYDTEVGPWKEYLGILHHKSV